MNDEGKSYLFQISDKKSLAWRENFLFRICCMFLIVGQNESCGI